MSGPGAAIRVPVREESDVVVARRAASDLARAAGFSASRAAALATAVTEVAWNIVVHAGEGEIVLEAVEDGGRHGIVVVARDEHPGIVDVEQAMQDGYTTAHGLGLGLPGARRLMDEFALVSALGEGTTVTMKKWVHALD
jgi:serine/threonine-protein kinase RsbT